MSEVIREYGKTVAAVLSAMLVILLLFGTAGFWNILEKGAYIAPFTQDAGKDEMAFQAVMEGSSPKIEYRSPGLGKGDCVPIEQLFFGLDGEGNFLEVKVRFVLSPNGTEVMETDGKILFETMGIYTCQVYAADSQGRRIEKQFKIPVLRE